VSCPADLGFGTVDGRFTSCDEMLDTYVSSTHQSKADGCIHWFRKYTVDQLSTSWATQYHLTYSKPPGARASMHVIELCQTTCALNGVMCDSRRR